MSEGKLDLLLAFTVFYRNLYFHDFLQDYFEVFHEQKKV